MLISGCEAAELASEAWCSILSEESSLFITHLRLVKITFAYSITYDQQHLELSSFLFQKQLQISLERKITHPGDLW
jgi:hypothetical protein